jgi:steroid delta-isomerase-like uncharacterized protein
MLPSCWRIQPVIAVHQPARRGSPPVGLITRIEVRPKRRQDLVRCVGAVMSARRGLALEINMDGMSDREVVEQYFQVVWVEGQWDRVEEFVAPDYINHGSFPGYPTSTIDDARRLYELGLRAFPDIRFTLARITGEDQLVARHWTAVATHVGEFMGVPGSARTIFQQGMVFSRLEGGKIVEEWRIIDSAGLLQQLRGEVTVTTD